MIIHSEVESDQDLPHHLIKVVNERDFKYEEPFTLVANVSILYLATDDYRRGNL